MGIAERISRLADISGALSIEALRGTDTAFSDNLQRVRPHKGQINTAANLRKLLGKSEIRRSHINSVVQDAYSLRCMPQVHGAVKDTIEYVKGVIETEINSATDNPLIFAKTNEHIEGGNFHGEPVALVMDFLKIALSELGNVSERNSSFYERITKRFAQISDRKGRLEFRFNDSAIYSGIIGIGKQSIITSCFG